MPPVRVRLFAAHREAAGRPSVALDLPAGATVKDVRSALKHALPALRNAGGTTVIAVNGQFAPDDQPVRAGDEVAAFPPVAGG
ncbi:MAG TPA: MoaD/ThiS family protein [Candidatus Thermoplasmatota archaeon]